MDHPLKPVTVTVKYNSILRTNTQFIINVVIFFLICPSLRKEYLCEKQFSAIFETLLSFYELYFVTYTMYVMHLQLIDGRSGVKRNILRSTSTGSSTTTPTPTHTPIPGPCLTDPLLTHSSFDVSDPLSQFIKEELDPLSKMAADEVLKPCFFNLCNIGGSGNGR